MTSNVVNLNQTPDDPSFTERNETMFDDHQDRSLRNLADALHRLNNAIVNAVDSGLTIELMRASRYHGEGGGKWGDQMVPIVMPKA